MFKSAIAGVVAATAAAESIGPAFEAFAEARGKLDEIQHNETRLVGLTDNMFYQHLLDIDLGDIQFSAGFEGDAFGSFSFPTFMDKIDGSSWIFFNPHVFGEISGKLIGTLKFGQNYFKMNFKMLAVKVAPFDFRLGWDSENTSRVCWGLSAFQKAFDATVTIQEMANECRVGITDSNQGWDCVLKQYNPVKPFYKADWRDWVDFGDDWKEEKAKFDWTCTDDYNLKAN